MWITLSTINLFCQTCSQLPHKISVVHYLAQNCFTVDVMKILRHILDNHLWAFKVRDVADYLSQPWATKPKVSALDVLVSEIEYGIKAGERGLSASECVEECLQLKDLRDSITKRLLA